MSNSSEGLGRRTVLKMAGVGGVGLVSVSFLGACGGSGESTSAALEVTDSMKSAVQTAVSAGIPVGKASFLKDAGVVVTHPTEAEYKVFSDVCPHQGGKVTMQEEKSGRLVCVLHGSQFDPATGKVVVGPSSAGLAPLPGAVPTK